MNILKASYTRQPPQASPPRTASTNILRGRLPKPLRASFSSDPSLPARYTEQSPLIVDNTILGTFATCYTKGLISYHHNLVSNADSLPLRLGSSVHKALERHYAGGTPQEAAEIFKASYYPYGSYEDPDSGLSWENTSATFDAWLAGHALENLPYEPLPGTIEGPVMAPLWPERWGKRVLYLGLLDLVVRDKATGILSIMDHKSTSKRLDDGWVNQFRTSAQLSGYLWLAQEARIGGASAPISSALINTLQFTRLPVSSRKCATHSTPYSICKGLHAVSRLDGPFTRSPWQLEQWLAEARALTDAWAMTRESFGSLESLRLASKRGLFQYEACKWCPFTPYCSGQISDAKRLPEFFTTREWTPWNPQAEETPA